MSNGPGRWLFGARPRRRGEGVTDVERTFVDREVVLDQVVAEVIAQIHRKTGAPRARSQFSRPVRAKGYPSVEADDEALPPLVMKGGSHSCATASDTGQRPECRSTSTRPRPTKDPGST